MKFPPLFLFIAFVLVIIGIFLWNIFPLHYFYLFPVTYNRCNYPCISIAVQGHSCKVVADIGSRFPLFLNEETLQNFNKSPETPIKWRNIQGTVHESPAYSFSKLEIGNLTIKNVVVGQTHEEEENTLGRFLGGEFNLFLDFPHSRIIACDTFERLQKKERLQKQWEVIPFEKERVGMIFHVKTDEGILRLVLNTTSTHSLIRSSLKSSEWTTATFMLGSEQMGSVTFDPFELPEALQGIDGFIGMDFLSKHAMYIDCLNEKAYIETQPSYFERIPITLGSGNVPRFDVVIEEKQYPLNLDFGFDVFFCLQKSVLQHIHKNSYGRMRWKNVFGEEFQAKTYTIPKVQIGSLAFINTMIVEDTRKVFLQKDELEPDGIMGKSILEKYNMFLDFPRLAMYACKNYHQLQEAGLLSSQLLIVPFKRNKDGIELSVKMDTGIHRLILDTGTTRIVMRSPYPPSTEEFIIQGHDFGKHTIRSLELISELDADGYLGMDFLLEHPLFIDYHNEFIVIDLKENARSPDADLKSLVQ